MKKLAITLTIAGALCVVFGRSQKTIISGKIANTAATEIKCSFIPNTVLGKPTAITIPVVQGSFKQILPVKATTFLSLQEGDNYYGGFIQAGDSIVIDYDAANLKNTLIFYGKGKEKFLLSDSINQVKSYASEHIAIIKKEPFPVDYFFGKMDSIENHLTQQLAAYKSSMSQQSFSFLQGLLQANLLRSKYNGVISIFGNSYDNILQTQASHLTDKSKKSLRNLLVFNGNLAASYFYTSIVANILSVYFDDNISPTTGNSLTAKYTELQKRIPAKLKPAVLFLLLEKDIKQHKDSALETLITKAFPAAKDSIYQNALTFQFTNARALKTGIAAPRFSVKNTDGNEVSLSTFKNKVIYLDFWFAACGPCHQLFTAIAPAKEYFRADTNVVFLTVSVDNNDIWKKALTKFNLPGYHVFTENKYRDHPIIKAYNVSQYPTTYLIGKNGYIISTKPSENAEELTKEIATALAAND